MQALSLYNLDERSTYHQYQQSSLVNCESLRRLAWSIIMTDMQVDCGHYGMHTIDDGTYTIQLPCEERSFLIGLDVVTEPIIPVPRHPGSIGNLGLTAHLLRAGLARRRILHSATKLARSMLPTSTIEQSVGRVEQQIRVLLDSLPQQLAYSTAHFLVYRDQQPTLLALHAYRCIAEIAFGRLRMMASDRIPEWQGQISKIRSDRVRHSLALSHLFADAIAHDVAIDPSLDTFVYVALEGRWAASLKYKLNVQPYYSSLHAWSTLGRPMFQIVMRLGLRSCHFCWPYARCPPIFQTLLCSIPRPFID